MKIGKRIYVAGPYSKPDPCINTHKAVLAADQLVEAGFVPFVPHLTHLWHLISPHTYEFWIRYDSHWLACCDAVLLLPGESAGAEKEVEQAMELSILVFTSVSEVIRHFSCELAAQAAGEGRCLI